MRTETVGLSIRKVFSLVEVAGLIKDGVRNIASILLETGEPARLAEAELLLCNRIIKSHGLLILFLINIYTTLLAANVV